MKNYSSYLPHIASKILKTMTLPCVICCSPCRMTLRLRQLPCGIVTCHCHVLLSLPHGTESTATAMWQKKVTTPPLIMDSDSDSDSDWDSDSDSDLKGLTV